MKLRQVLRVAIEELERKVDLGEAVIQEMKDKPPPKVVADPPGRVAEQEIGIKPKLPLFDSFDDLSFSFVVAWHRDLYRLELGGNSLLPSHLAPPVRLSLTTPKAAG